VDKTENKTDVPHDYIELKTPEAIGYNIRYGTRKDKLYQNYQVFGVDSLTIRSLNSLHKYYFTINAFNENGITKGENIVELN
jgi:hypothetical protein